MITFTWTIEKLKAAPNYDGLTNAVIVASWKCGAVDGIYSAYQYGSCSFNPSVEGFTPFASLTEQQVLEWCWGSGATKIEIEDALTLKIAELADPPIVTLPLPWVV